MGQRLYIGAQGVRPLVEMMGATALIQEAKSGYCIDSRQHDLNTFIWVLDTTILERTLGGFHLADPHFSQANPADSMKFSWGQTKKRGSIGKNGSIKNGKQKKVVLE
ncbi:MAG: hypothetical protein NTZ74_10475 [Chloroflexi bacterium]|nr:hypothetical protein [Chloroflexota bacterium]